MAKLRALADELWPEVPSRSYIASGNLIVQADTTERDIADRLTKRIASDFGFDVPVLAVNAAEFVKAITRCPYDVDEPKHVHGYFCLAPPQVDHALLTSLRTPYDQVTIAQDVIWLHTAKGFSASKLADKMPRVAGVSVTARNLNTCRKLVEMLDG